MVSKIGKRVLVKYARARRRNQGQCCGRSHGSSISMVLRCGQKPSGEQVVSVIKLRSRTTDRPDKHEKKAIEYYEFNPDVGGPTL